jgi:uncharacterized protein (DUF1499 family)
MEQRHSARWQPLVTRSRAGLRCGPQSHAVEVTLPAVDALEPAPGRKGFRIAPQDWSGPADAASPVFHIDAVDLWHVWLDFAANQPRTVLRAKDEQHRRSLHVQRSLVFRFSDLVRAEVMPLGIQRSSLILDSRACLGCWDFAVNRRRLLRWVHHLKQAMAYDGSE